MNGTFLINSNQKYHKIASMIKKHTRCMYIFGVKPAVMTLVQCIKYKDSLSSVKLILKNRQRFIQTLINNLLSVNMKIKGTTKKAN